MKLFNEVQSGCEVDLYQPLLACIDAQKFDRKSPPYIPKWEAMSFSKLCRFASFLHQANFFEEAGRLAYFLDTFQNFLTLWCSEKEYNVLHFEKYFAEITQIKRVAHKDFLDCTLYKSPSIQAVFTTSGNETSLGVIQAKGIEVRAFGPQNQSLQFGIQGKGEFGWSQSFAMPEVWLRLHSLLEKDQLQLKLDFVGLHSKKPLYLAFYLKAKQCEVNQRVFFPKSLKRFHGEAQKITFQNYFSLRFSSPFQLQIIPLAGERCFWDCEFLILVKISPFLSSITTTFKTF